MKAECENNTVTALNTPEKKNTNGVSTSPDNNAGGNTSTPSPSKMVRMYSSEYLKAFNKDRATLTTSGELMEETRENDGKKYRPKELQYDKLFSQFERKEYEYNVAVYLLLRLRDIISEKKEDSVLQNKLQEVLSELEDFAWLQGASAPGKPVPPVVQSPPKNANATTTTTNNNNNSGGGNLVPNLKLPEANSVSPPLTSPNSASQLSSPSGLSSSGGLSGRGAGSSPGGASNFAAATAAGAAATTLASKSPRRKSPQEPLQPIVLESNASTATGAGTGATATTGAPTVTPAPTTTPTKSMRSPRRTTSSGQLVTSPPGLAAPAGGGGGGGGGAAAAGGTPTTPPVLTSSSAKTVSATHAKTMKKSPSMSVLTDRAIHSSDFNAANQVSQGNVKLNKRTKSIENLASMVPKNLRIKVPESEPKDRDSTPRAPGNLKKSVSMTNLASEELHQSSSLSHTSLEEIVGQIYPLTKYQAGCRFLQKKLEEQPDSLHVTMIFNEVYEHLIELMTDPYGQYLVPKLMKFCDVGQRQQIATKIAPHIVEFACHTYGIHGVQKILEYLNDEQVGLFIDSMRDNVITLAKDTKGNYLIQSFLKQFSPERNQFIFDSITKNCKEISTHKVGCTLVNRCIDHANDQQLEVLAQKVISGTLELVQDQFGNYVVQHLLTTRKNYADRIIKSMQGHIAQLSVQKFSSNVVEKCLQVATPDLYTFLVNEITEANLLELLQDRYANFVIQTALDVADEQQHARLVKLILPYIHQIKTPYVMHIQKKILQV